MKQDFDNKTLELLPARGPVRKYKTNAERQAAYRTRKAEKLAEISDDDRLAMILKRLVDYYGFRKVCDQLDFFE